MEVGPKLRFGVVDEPEPVCSGHLHWLSVGFVADIDFECRLCLNLPY